MNIERLEFLRTNVSKLNRHGITEAEVRSGIDRTSWVVSVNDGYPGQIRVTGLTATGRLITVAMEQVDEGVWRPVTGWDATPSE